MTLPSSEVEPRPTASASSNALITRGHAPASLATTTPDDPRFQDLLRWMNLMP